MLQKKKKTDFLWIILNTIPKINTISSNDTFLISKLLIRSNLYKLPKKLLQIKPFPQRKLILHIHCPDITPYLLFRF